MDLPGRDSSRRGISFLRLCAAGPSGRQSGIRSVPPHAAPRLRHVRTDFSFRPGRLRRQGRARPVSHLAARSPSRGAGPRVRFDVRRDDQDGPLWAAARRDLPGAASPVVGTDARRARPAHGLVGASLALYQRDVKRVLAYSSIENMGLISLALGVGLWGLASGFVVVAVLGTWRGCSTSGITLS